ncbi:hypothetical protein FA13DRAFT_1782923 [Coprinellus micaceus]|uniref:Uncharacterized protein n=1 Tax=Coprinellus micaceus TaxID=71717 RepID=A0A4Y7RT16_COPMI|nr:hypothetical protein FA13DRAFT_1782923 [Coprinellus micaceus]
MTTRPVARTPTYQDPSSLSVAWHTNWVNDVNSRRSQSNKKCAPSRRLRTRQPTPPKNQSRRSSGVRYLRLGVSDKRNNVGCTHGMVVRGRGSWDASLVICDSGRVDSSMGGMLECSDQGSVLAATYDLAVPSLSAWFSMSSTGQPPRLPRYILIAVLLGFSASHSVGKRDSGDRHGWARVLSGIQSVDDLIRVIQSHPPSQSKYRSHSHAIRNIVVQSRVMLQIMSDTILSFKWEYQPPCVLFGSLSFESCRMTPPSTDSSPSIRMVQKRMDTAGYPVTAHPCRSLDQRDASKVILPYISPSLQKSPGRFFTGPDGQPNNIGVSLAARIVRLLVSLSGEHPDVILPSKKIVDLALELWLAISDLMKEVLVRKIQQQTRKSWYKRLASSWLWHCKQWMSGLGHDPARARDLVYGQLIPILSVCFGIARLVPRFYDALVDQGAAGGVFRDTGLSEEGMGPDGPSGEGLCPIRHRVFPGTSKYDLEITDSGAKPDTSSFPNWRMLRNASKLVLLRPSIQPPNLIDAGSNQ